LFRATGSCDAASVLPYRVAYFGLTHRMPGGGCGLLLKAPHARFLQAVLRAWVKYGFLRWRGTRGHPRLQGRHSRRSGSSCRSYLFGNSLGSVFHVYKSFHRLVEHHSVFHSHFREGRPSAGNHCHNIVTACRFYMGRQHFFINGIAQIYPNGFSFRSPSLPEPPCAGSWSLASGDSSIHSSWSLSTRARV